MPEPGAKDEKTLPEATHKASEQHGDAINPGIFSAVKVAFVDAAKTDLLGTIDRIYSFRNEYIAHQEKELDNMNIAKQAMDEWIKGLMLILRT
jgi:3-dehydroquinate dehydratase